MEQLNFSNKRLVSDTGETKTYLININGTDVRAYESAKTNRFGFNMKDLAKAFNYQTVEEFQASEQWKEFSSQISENLKKNTSNEEEAKIGKVSDVIGDVPTASTLSAKSAKATSQWVERAGINGALTAPDDVFLYGGGTLDEAVEGVTPILFRADGSGHVAGRNISWDASGNLKVVGTYRTADSGARIEIDPTNMTMGYIGNSERVYSVWKATGHTVAMDFFTYTGTEENFTTRSSIGQMGIDLLGSNFVIQGGKIYLIGVPTSRDDAEVNQAYLDGETLKVRRS